MRFPIFHLDAFASVRFSGNPAAVVVLDDYPDDDVLRSIAAENNLSETAFLAPADDAWRLRWFTPAVEVPLCGHATLASAWVILERIWPTRSQVTFLTRYSGALRVERDGREYAMDLPALPTEPAGAPPELRELLGGAIVELRANATNYLAVVESASVVRRLAPDMAAIARLDRSGLIVTAPGDEGYDCVSRYFAPKKGIPEDPVTGGAHCAIVPYWAARLGKTQLRAYQASRRGGVLRCTALDARVRICGPCVLYSHGEVELDG